MKDYDLSISLHSGKANVMANALRWKCFSNVAVLLTSQKSILQDIKRMELQVVLRNPSVILANSVIQLTPLGKIKTAQGRDKYLQKIRQKVEASSKGQFRVHDDSLLRFTEGVCILDDLELKKDITEEAYLTSYSVHPSSTKMYRDLKNTFRWNNMKLEIAQFVAQYLTYQQVKAEHQSPWGFFNPFLFLSGSGKILLWIFLFKLP